MRIPMKIKKQYNKKSNCILVPFISIVGIIFLLILTAIPSNAQIFEWHPGEDYVSMAPSSIPVPETPGVGTSDVGMARLRFRNTDAANSEVFSVRVQLLSDNIASIRSKISRVKVYHDPNDNVFDRGGGDDNLVGTSALIPFSAVDTIDISVSGVIFNNATNWNKLFVAFDFAPDTDETTNVGCEVLRVDWDPQGDPLPRTQTVPPSSPLIPSPRDDIDDYEMSLTATGIAPSPANGGQGDRNVEILKLDFSLVTETSLTAKVDSIRLHRIGTGSDSDIPGGGVLLYLDSGDIPGTFDSADELLDTDTLSGGYVLLDPVSDDAIIITSSTVTCFVTLNISVNASVGATVGLEVEDPSTDINFVDIHDNVNPLDPEYAFTTVEYLQSGYITSTTLTPTSDNIITITLLALDLPIPDEPVAANNRILPGQTDPVRIYIPEPPGGPSEKVTVQVYTIAGQRVATLVNNQRYSQISGSLPLEWFGKNQKQKDLGPGLYFIQIKTSSYTKILKVLIVR